MGTNDIGTNEIGTNEIGTNEIKGELTNIVDKAQKRLDIEIAQNPTLRKAVHIVEEFLKKSHRVCYGGQAINAQLPVKDQFYNPDASLPDYDFFSPDSKGDTDILIEDLKAAGYTEITKRFGIHEGTSKLYVNFTAIADITQVIPDFYDAIYTKSVVINGIHYADPIFLRMMMYLELSRPRGAVGRWEKVYERLKILNAAQPLTNCHKTYNESKAASDSRPAIVRYMIREHRAFMGADIHMLYRGSTRSAASRTKFLLNGMAPVVFLSPDAQMDADILAEQINARKVSIVGYQNILPAMITLYHDTTLVCVIVQEEACHSIVILPLTKHRKLRIASLDTLLTFLIGLYYRKDSLVMTQEALLCWLRHYIDLSNRYKHKPTAVFPAFSIECSGYQTTFASLLRAKVARVEAARQVISSGKRTTSKRTTSKRTTSKRTTAKRHSRNH